MKKNILFIGIGIVVILALVLFFVFGISKTVAEITASDKFLGETVTVRGTAESPLKIGEISGYTLVDKNNDKIIVASERLPAEGDKVTAKGILKKGPIIGYYIDVE